MQLSLTLSVFGSILAITNAKWFKSNDETPSWTPAKKTGATSELDPTGMTPRPTPAPGDEFLEQELRKRIATSTCAYYAQYSSSAALWCVDSDGYCAVDNHNMAVGCCDSPNMADCTIPTWCIDSTEAPSFSADFTNSYTLFCTEADYPNCVTLSYDAYDPVIPSYSAFGCNVESALYSVEFYPPELGSSIDAGITTVSSAMLVMSSSALPSAATSTTSSMTSSSTASNQTSGTSEPTPIPKKTAIAPIVGGTVGGVAGLALIGLSLFFIIRSSRRTGSRPAAPPPVMTTNMQYPGPNGGHPSWTATSPPMSQVPQQFGGYAPAGFTAVDQRASTIAPSSYFPQSQKSQFEVVQVAAGPVSPSTSPAPTSPSTQSPSTGFQTTLGRSVSSSEGTHQVRYSVHDQGIAIQQQQQHQVYSVQHGQAAELPLTRPDGELRELA